MVVRCRTFAVCFMTGLRSSPIDKLVQHAKNYSMQDGSERQKLVSMYEINLRINDVKRLDAHVATSNFNIFFFFI